MVNTKLPYRSICSNCDKILTFRAARYSILLSEHTVEYRNARKNVKLMI